MPAEVNELGQRRAAFAHGRESTALKAVGRVLLRLDRRLARQHATCAQHLLGPALNDVVQDALVHALGLHVSLADRTPERPATFDAGGLYPDAYRLERQALLDGQILTVAGLLRSPHPRVY